MPHAFPLLDHMYTSFRRVFGEPSSMLEMDSQWTLHPDPDPRAPALFMLVNGSYTKPAVWLFDPYHGGENVWRTAVEAEADVDRIIELVQKRVVAAGSFWRDGGPARRNPSPTADGTADGAERSE